jgi:hypothetical protein
MDDSEIWGTLMLTVIQHRGGRCTLEPTAHPDTIQVAVHDPSRHVPRMRTPDLNGGTGGFGWPMITGLAHATVPTRRASGGKTVSASLPGSVTAQAAGWPTNMVRLIPQPDELPGDVAALVEAGQSNQKSLAAATGGAAVTRSAGSRSAVEAEGVGCAVGFRPLGRVHPPSSTPREGGRAAHAPAVPCRPDPAGQR